MKADARQWGISLLSPAADDSGGRTYLRGLLSGLAELDDPDRWELYSHPGNQTVVTALPRGARWNFLVGAAGRPGRVFREQWKVPALCRQSGVAALLCPNGSIPLKGKVPTVLVMQNVLSFFANDDEGPVRHAYRRWILPRSARLATHIIVPSLFARGVLLKRFPELESKVHVVPHGVDIPISEQNAGPLAQPYILWVSALWKYKNWSPALAAYAQLRKSGLPHRFVLVGRAEGVSGKRQLQRRLSELGIAGETTHLESASVLELSRLYLGASLLLYPSSIESFGLPVLEAMAAGTPVVISDCGALRELAGDAAVSVRPESGELADAMGRILSDPALAAQLVKNGRTRAAQYSWRLTAERTRAILQLAATARISV